MNLLNRLFMAGMCAAVLSGCSESSPSPTIGQEALRQEIESQSQGQIKLLSFSKTDGQKFEVNGIAGYAMDYEAVIEFNQGGNWLAGGYGPDRLGFGFSTVRPGGGTIDAFLNQAIDGGKAVVRGTRVKIAGTMTGVKKESGWKFEPGNSRVANMMP